MIRCRERERTDRSGRGTERVVAATSYLIRYSLEPLVPARSSISLSESVSHPLGDAGLDPRATACTRPDGLRTCSVVSCVRPALSLRSGSLSLTAPMQVAGPLLQVSGPSPAHAFPSVPIRTQTGHSRPSHSAPWGNILSPGAPGMPRQRIYPPGIYLDGSGTESLRYLCSNFVLTHVLKPWYVLPHHVTPLPPYSVARQHTRPRHVATLSSSDGRTQRMQPMRIEIWSQCVSKSPQRSKCLLWRKMLLRITTWTRSLSTRLQAMSNQLGTSCQSLRPTFLSMHHWVFRRWPSPLPTTITRSVPVSQGPLRDVLCNHDKWERRRSWVLGMVRYGTR